MNANFYPALVAILVAFPVGVALFTPFVALEYRREGRLTARRVLLWAAVVLYGIALWTYTLLPLPAAGSYECLPPQLDPLRFLSDIATYPYKSPGALLRNPAVAQVVLNVALFVPLGVFLRLVWRRGLVASVLAGFLVSLTIEVTQLTGLWGIYSCAYRWFDVDDLLANTAGAVAGTLLSLLLRRRKQTASGTVVGPTPVTLLRRVVGIVCDLTALVVVGAVFRVLLLVYWQTFEPVNADRTLAQLLTVASVVLPVTLAGVLVLVTGRTIGDHATLIQWDGGPRPVLLARALRFLCSTGPWLAVATYLPDYAFLITVALAVVLIARRDRSGILGLLTRMRPVDTRLAARAEQPDEPGANVQTP